MQTPSFVGRTGPLAAFTGALRSTTSAPGTPAVLYVHGPAGIGKTALLHRFAALARTEHRHVVEIDAARVASAPALIDQVRETATRSGSVLLVDGIDHVGAADDTLPSSLLRRPRR
ncbi:ATP-binding protein [Streptomyces sp. NPDC006527]|jgi:chromosomal replication initiation ATPase DnaA|uniref:ATP-binding protein n=1 Tax=Streptomyces sp. NPDC006527 TaxID=3364749 RepID=UPI0036C9722C